MTEPLPLQALVGRSSILQPADPPKLPPISETGRLSIQLPDARRSTERKGLSMTALPTATNTPPLVPETPRESPPVPDALPSLGHRGIMKRVVRKQAEASENGWTVEFAEELLRMQANCYFYQKECDTSSSSNTRWSSALQILSILGGVATVILATASLDEEFKKLALAFVGFIVGGANGIAAKMAFEQYAEKQYSGSIEFGKIARAIQLELMKKSHTREEPILFITAISGKVEELLHAVKIPNLVKEETSCPVQPTYSGKPVETV